MKARELATLLTEEAKKSGFDITFSPQEVYGARSAKTQGKGRRRGRRRAAMTSTVHSNGTQQARALRKQSGSTVSEAIDHLQIAIRDLGATGVRKIMDLIG